MKQLLPKPWLLGICLTFLITNFVQAQPFRGCATGNERVAPVNESHEREVLRLVNVERKKRGLQLLTWNAKMARAARYHAADMAHDDYFNHASYDRGGKKVCATFTRIRKFGPASAENIAVGGNTPAGTMRQWMNSPGHKKNILSPSSKSLGVGYYYKPGLKNKWRHYWVQNFSRQVTNGSSGGSNTGGGNTGNSGNSGNIGNNGKKKLKTNRSYVSNIPATLEIKNRTNGTIKGFWVDYQGRERFYFNLRAGGTIRQKTGTKNLWRIKNARGRVLRNIFMRQRYRKVNIGGGSRNNNTKMRRKSLQSKTKATLRITNRTNGKLVLYWIDTQGKERYYYTLKRGQAYTQRTFTKHLWRIKNGQGRMVRQIFMNKTYVNRVIK